MIVFREQELISLSYIWTWLQESSRETCPGWLASTPTHTLYTMRTCGEESDCNELLNAEILEPKREKRPVPRTTVNKTTIFWAFDRHIPLCCYAAAATAGWPGCNVLRDNQIYYTGWRSVHPRHWINSELHVEQMRKWTEDTHEEEEEDWDGSSSLL